MAGYIDKAMIRLKRSGRTLFHAVAASAFIFGLVIAPGLAEASVGIVNPWPATPHIVSNSAASPVTGRIVPGANVNRMMLVAVACEYTAAPGAQTLSVTYGGVTVNQLVTNSAQKSTIWLGYLNENDIATGSSGTKVLSVTNSNTTNLLGMYASAAVFSGVTQAAPVGALSASTAPALSTALTNLSVYGQTGNTGMSVYAVNWDGQSSSPSAGYTELSDYAGLNLNLAGSFKDTTSGTEATITSTVGSNASGAIAGVGLNPAASVAGTVITSCGQCHGYPPFDAPGRNSIQGVFSGSHSKHAGFDYGQAALACTKCHYNHITNNHQSGFKNITGSSLPKTAYSLGFKIQVTNATGAGTCSTVYCHSSARGTGLGTKQYVTTSQWGTKTVNSCRNCHGGRDYSTSNLAASVAGFMLSTTHAQHLKYPAININCQICHSKTNVTDAWTLKPYSSQTSHVNGIRNVTFTDIGYGSYSSYKNNEAGLSAATSADPNYRKCTNIACHGGITRNPWSATTTNNNNTCVHCHGTVGTSTAVTNTAANRKFFAPGYKSGGNTGTSTDGSSSSNNIRVGSHFKHISSAYMKQRTCTECHRVPSSPFDGANTHIEKTRYGSKTLIFDQASSATIVSGVYSGSTPAVYAPAAFSGYTAGDGSKAATCSSVYCHGNRLLHGDTSGTYRKPFWNYSNMVNYSQPSVACGRCHGNPPSSGSTASVHSGKSATVSCYKCHGVVVNAAGTIVNKALHINGQMNMSAGCNACHGYPPQVITYGGYSGLASPVTGVLGSTPTVPGAHMKHKSQQILCSACHFNNGLGGGGTTVGTHRNSNVQIFFRLSSSTFPLWNAASSMFKFGTYSAPSNGAASPVIASPGGTTTVVTAAAGRNSCSVYCHGGWNGSNKNINPAWEGAAMQCGNCHGASAAAPPKIGSHARHAGYGGGTFANNTSGYAFKCINCHPNRLASDHVKGTLHVRFSTAVMGANASYTKANATLTQPVGVRLYNTNSMAGSSPDGTCSGIYCHGSARATGLGTAQYATTSNWGTTPGGERCLRCHGGRNASGNYAPSAAGFKLSTTHSQHLGKYPLANMNCQICHSKTAASHASLKNFTGMITHANKVRNVTFTDVGYGSYSSYKNNEAGLSAAGSGDPNYRKCSNVACHGGITRNAWSATATNNDNTCVHCHGTATTAAGLANTAANRKFFAPGYKSGVNTGTSTDGSSSSANIRVGAHFKHLSSMYMKKLNCSECHRVPSSPFDGANTHIEKTRYGSQTLTFAQASTATIVIGVSSASTPTVFAPAAFSGYTAGLSNKAATCSSVYCHGNRLKNNETGGTYRKPYWNYSALINYTAPAANVCATCHGYPPTFSGHTASTVCSSCHSNISAGDNRSIINKALHINGKVEASNNCNTCHNYDVTAGPVWTSPGNYGTFSQADGAHAKHIAYLKTRFSVTLDPAADSVAGFGTGNAAKICGVCHTNTLANHTPGTPANPRSITFGTFTAHHHVPGSPVLYNGASNVNGGTQPKTCSNIDCHYKTTPAWY